MYEDIIERKAKAIYDHIMEMRKITDLDEDLIEFVEKEFDKYGLNFMVIGKFNGGGEAKISLNLNAHTPLKSTEELKRCLDASVATYLRELEDDMTVCKNLVYKRLQLYQVKQKPDTFE